MSHHEPHLDVARIQDFLDERLSSPEEAALRKHLDGCVACRGEMEAWRAVFAGLGRMPRLAPSPLLAERVMAEIREPSKAGLLDRLRALLPTRGGKGGKAGHPAPQILLGYLDEALSPGRSAHVAAHMRACAACREEMTGWRAVVEKLEALGPVAPSPGFADAVMAHVRVPEREPAGAWADLGQRITEWIGRVRPRTRRGWAVASVPVVAPVAAFATAVLALFSSHPLLTPASLTSFVWWQATAMVDGLATAAIRTALDSPLVLETWRAIQGFLADPVMLGAGALAFSAATAAALWILYRNLTSAPPVDRGYANVSA